MQRYRQVLVIDAPELAEHQLGLASGVDEDDRQAMRPERGVDLGNGIAGGVAGPR